MLEKRTVAGVIFSYQLSICIDNCTLHVQRFLKNMEEQKLGVNYQYPRYHQI